MDFFVLALNFFRLRWNLEHSRISGNFTRLPLHDTLTLTSNSIMNDQLLLFVLLVALLINKRAKAGSAPIISANYSADPLFKFETQILHPGSFRTIYHLEPHVFISEIIAEVLPNSGLPRNYSLRDDYNLIGYVSKLRKCQIDNIDRWCRMILVNRAVPVAVVAYLYDQHQSTVYRDYHHCTYLFCDKLADKVVSPIIPNSTEYYDKIGARAFRHFPRALYAYDIVKVTVLHCVCYSL